MWSGVTFSLQSCLSMVQLHPAPNWATGPNCIFSRRCVRFLFPASTWICAKEDLLLDWIESQFSRFTLDRAWEGLPAHQHLTQHLTPTPIQTTSQFHLLSLSSLRKGWVSSTGIAIAVLCALQRARRPPSPSAALKNDGPDVCMCCVCAFFSLVPVQPWGVFREAFVSCVPAGFGHWRDSSHCVSMRRDRSRPFLLVIPASSASLCANLPNIPLSCHVLRGSRAGQRIATNDAVGELRRDSADPNMNTTMCMVLIMPIIPYRPHPHCSTHPQRSIIDAT